MEQQIILSFNEMEFLEFIIDHKDFTPKNAQEIYTDFDGETTEYFEIQGITLEYTARSYGSTEYEEETNAGTFYFSHLDIYDIELANDEGDIIETSEAFTNKLIEIISEH